jgi:alkylation response protein AidB-like acyl-CoA dehydrogenase
VSVVGPLDHLAVVRTSERPAEAAGPDTTAVTELARLRHAWSGQLLRDVVDHLATRTTGGKPLLEQQLVKSSLADAFIGRQETETVLTASDAGGGELDLVHERITEVDRTLLRLLGAHGFTADGPGSVAYVSELLAHVYTRRADHDGT